MCFRVPKEAGALNPPRTGGTSGCKLFEMGAGN